MSIKIRGELEIDQARGVIYFHSSRREHPPTPLRICKVGLVEDLRKGMLDITMQKDGFKKEYYPFPSLKES